MVKRTKSMAVAGGLALALAGAGAGVAAAQTSTTPTPPGTSAAAPGAAATPGAKKADRADRLARRVQHGEFTVRTKNGPKVLDVQRGVVTAVDAGSITVKSDDGFSATYTISPNTKVHKAKKPATVSQVAANDRVRLVASKNGGTATVERIGDAGPAK